MVAPRKFGKWAKVCCCILNVLRGVTLPSHISKVGSLIKFRSRFSIALILTTEVVPLPDTEEFGPELDRLFHLACEK